MKGGQEKRGEQGAGRQAEEGLSGHEDSELKGSVGDFGSHRLPLAAENRSL